MRQYTLRTRAGKMHTSYILAKSFLKEPTDSPHPLPPLLITHSCPIWYALVTAATAGKLIKIKLCVLSSVACFLQGCWAAGFMPLLHLHTCFMSHPSQGEEAENEDALMQEPGFPKYSEEQDHSKGWANVLMIPNI